MKEMVGGCCVCSDERGWAENPLVYCDGHGCNVAVHQACYGIVQVPTGPWFCRKCESQERAARVRCELCPHKEGALKRTDNGGWAHVVCALYIPEVQFANVLTMEPIVLQFVPHDRFHKTCYICEEQGRESKAASGACMTCNRHGCRQAFHVTCAQSAGLLCEEEALEADNVKYIGYCKYHFTKMTFRHPGGCPYIPGRRSRSVSPAQEKLVIQPERQKKSRKDREKPKQRHKKHPESPGLLTPPAAVIPTAENSADQLESEKDSQEVVKTEVKGKKSSGHGTGHRGRKTGGGKGVSNFSTSAGSTFQTGAPPISLPSLSPDFVTFPKLEQQQEEKGTPTCSPRCSPPYPAPKAELFEQKVTFSSFGSIMRFSTSVSQPRGRDSSPIDFKATAMPSGPSTGSHKRTTPTNAQDGGENVKEKKRRGGKKSKHGPGRPKGSKNKEPPTLALTGTTATASSPFSGGSIASSSICNSSRNFSHAGSLPSHTLESNLLSSGIYTSNKDPISHTGGVLRAACSTPLSTSILSHQTANSLPPFNRASFASSLPATSSSSSTVFSLAGSTFSLPSPHIFGSPLTSGLSIAPHLNQPDHSNRSNTDMENCNFICRGSSPRESLSSMSPISSLPTVFDQAATCSNNPTTQVENAPPATPNIEQLLEKHGNGEAGVNIVEMLKALHSLQKENQCLQEQIMTLTAKKERLQHLNIQLSVPFPVVGASNGPTIHTHSLLPQNAVNHDSLSISKSPSCKSSFRTENSLSASSEDPPSGCQSRSSSSLSFHSTPPPVSLSQTSGSHPLGIQQQQLVNGLTRVTGSGLGGGTSASHTLSSIPMVGNLLGSLSATQHQVPMNGILGALNGEIQGGTALSQSQSPLGQSSAPLTLQLPSTLNSLPGLNPLTEQQRHLLHQHEQQLQQLQQLLLSPQLTTEQQTLVYQMMQQIQQRRELQRLHMAGAAQVPLSNLLTSTTTALLHSGTNLMTPTTAPTLIAGSSLMTSPGHAGNSLITSAAAGPPALSAQINPFLSLPGDSNAQKVARASEKGGLVSQDKG
ncbi:protein AF-17 isoform X2 [Ambystoma mexicanum]|uniref:protein AF-17 isoform X2 n=1 Tax=Ambystoma mexicanum TaxID=8296 RepID=UPI0037E7D177